MIWSSSSTGSASSSDMAGGVMTRCAVWFCIFVGAVGMVPPLRALSSLEARIIRISDTLDTIEEVFKEISKNIEE